MQQALPFQGKCWGLFYHRGTYTPMIQFKRGRDVWIGEPLGATHGEDLKAVPPPIFTR